MSAVNDVNRFFMKRYNNLGSLAVSPVSWRLSPRTGDYDFDIGGLVLKAFLAPVLIPATLVTTVLAAALALVAAVLHVFGLAGAASVDTFSPQASEFAL
jgi:hypothetical protein